MNFQVALCWAIQVCLRNIFFELEVDCDVIVTF